MYFNVTGSGLFPYGMLRHDQAFPANLSGIHALEQPSVQRTGTFYTKKQPNSAKWESFGWKVYVLDVAPSGPNITSSPRSKGLLGRLLSAFRQ
jgi:hypothetical protein